MRLLVDENLFWEIVVALRGLGHDVVWVRDVFPGAGDDVLLAISVAEGRILVSEDRDFGELIFKRDLPAVGIVLAKVSEFGKDIDAISTHVANVINEYGDKLLGHTTVIEPGRERHSPLPDGAKIDRTYFGPEGGST